MKAESIQIVQRSYASLAPSGEKNVLLFCHQLVRLTPALGQRWPEIPREKLAYAFGQAVAHLPHPDRILFSVQQWSRSLRDSRFGGHHFAVAHRALLWTLETQLGEALCTPQLKAAWSEAYWYYVRILKQTMQRPRESMAA